MRRIDLADLDRSQRWRLDMELRDRGIAHTWHRSLLDLPVGALGLIDEVVGRVPNAATGAADRPPADSSRPQPTGPALAPGPLSLRLVAFVLDWLLLVAAPLWILQSRTRIIPEHHIQVRGRTVTVLTVHARVPDAQLVVVVVVALLYFVVGVALFGRTMGKVVTRLEVVGRDGARPGWTAAIVRAAVVAAGWILGVTTAAIFGSERPAAVAAISLLWPVMVVLPVFFDPARRGLHDRVAGTRVIQRGEAPFN